MGTFNKYEIMIKVIFNHSICMVGAYQYTIKCTLSETK